jgi:hypothetical protein
MARSKNPALDGSPLRGGERVRGGRPGMSGGWSVAVLSASAVSDDNSDMRNFGVLC